MNRQNLRTTLLATLLSVACGSPALADDTDVFVGQIANPGAPNLLFMFDTSGSMNSQVVVGDDYDASIVYEGVCDKTAVFWSLQSTGKVLLPDCTLATFVNLDAFRCDAALTAFEESGYYRDTYAQWDADEDAQNSIWTSIVSAFSGDIPTGEFRQVDCESDNGIHGAIDGSANVYPADGANGPWTDTETPGFWDDKGDTYTFYSGNFLNYVASDRDGVLDTRMEVLQGVATDLISSMSEINVGIIRFSASTDGGQILHEVANVNDNRDDLISIINGLVPAGSTPLAETLFEASQYYSGRDVFFGFGATDENGDPEPSVPESYDEDSGNYISPIVRECQRNFVVVLTDGQPVDDDAADGEIELLPGFSGSCSGNCLDDLAIYMNTEDQLPDATGLDGEQIVETYVIGFATDQDLLESASTGRVPQYDENGDVIVDPDTGDPVTEPGYFVANDTMQLMSAFDSILRAIETTTQSFASPSVSINTFDRFTNRDELYFAMFKPGELGQPHWDGNVKKYRLVSSDGEIVIVDVNDNAAIDDDGEIAPNAQSFWSASVDGADVSAGGVAGRLSTERNVYTNLFGPSLNTPDNLLSSSNDKLEAGFFDDYMAVADEDVPVLADFARGIDENGDARKVLGDPLHSRPLVVSFGGDNAQNEDLTLFFTTNDGYFHAVDPNPADGTTGDLELFSFIPKELLSNLPLIKENAEQSPGNFEKLYGLDGGLTRWIQGDNGNLQVDPSESLYIIFGMRRGGRNYYSLNLTDRANPRVAWTIEGGQGDFAELGQTWGSAIVGNIRWDGTEKPVLILSGGYDPGHDNGDGSSETDSMGRAIFIVDAFTGQLLWTASGDEGGSPDLYLEDMTNSIPSDPRVLDINRDGLIDRIYVGDTAAQLWRFDIFNDTDDDDAIITGGRIADFGGAGSSGNRRFFYPPSVTRIVDQRYGSFLAIAAGTGFRADPLGEGVSDRFYVLRDANVFTPQVDEDGNPIYSTATEADLLDITTNLEPTVDELNAKDGWRLELVVAPGEKLLAAPLSVDNRIFFTTYLPGTQPLSCDPVIARGRGLLYELELLFGSPVNYDDLPTPEDRYLELDQEGIPPAPVLVFTEPPCDDCDAGDDGDDGDDGDGDDPDTPVLDPTGCINPFSTVTMVIGTQVTDPNICNAPVRTYWYQEDTD